MWCIVSRTLSSRSLHFWIDRYIQWTRSNFISKTKTALEEFLLIGIRTRNNLNAREYGISCCTQSRINLHITELSGDFVYKSCSCYSICLQLQIPLKNVKWISTELLSSYFFRIPDYFWRFALIRCCTIFV